ncbi:redoxin domain-containing protein [Terribacillus sp. 179-K 1B1 HS]|uniref:redoxin domain-containing protein n=1 Tax=Terribacillus sp. 179-K 1B1 HS TaxID=3142388 RepID=UPI0039A04816
MTSTRKKRFYIRLTVLAALAGLVLTAGWQLLVEGKSEKVETGEKAPDFMLKDIQTGEEFKLSEMKGKGVLVNFWATYCEPCKQEMPLFEEASNTYENDNVIFAAISEDESKLVIDRFREQHNLSFPIMQDNGQVMEAYGVDALPATFFIRADGTVSRTVYGPLQTDRLEDYLDEIVP